MRNEAYEDIMSLRGFDEFKALAGRLSQLAANRRSLPEANIRVPNFLFVEAPGAGVTTQIRLLTRLLQETRLMRFTGEKRFFEWVLGEDAFEPGGGFDRLLRQVNALLRENGYRVGNADCIVIAQRPKLAPYIPAMRQILSQAMGIDFTRVSVKATTEEGLGFSGQGLGIAAQAVVLLEET